jgi:hypothetical protein
MSSLTHKHSATQRTEISDEFLKQLKEDIAWRRIESGLRCLAIHRELVESCELQQKNAAVLLGYFAQWVDLGFSGRELLKRLLSRSAVGIRSLEFGQRTGGHVGRGICKRDQAL